MKSPVEPGGSRQTSPADPPALAYAFGPYRLEVASRQLSCAGQPVHLFSKALETLLALLAHRDRVVTKEELVSWVWPDTFVSDESVTQAVSVLRRTFGEHDFIVTVPRRGYRFIGPVVEFPAAPTPATDVPVVTEPVATPEPTRHAEAPTTLSTAAAFGLARLRPQGRRLVLVSAGLLLCAFGIWETLNAVPADGVHGAFRRSIQFTEEAPVGTRLVSNGALSPNGRYLAFTAADIPTRDTRLWVRDFETGEYRPLASTQGAVKPFWSPDSESVGFFEGATLSIVALRSGQPKVVTLLPRDESGTRLNRAVATWNRAGVILFSGWRTGLNRVSAAGGEVVPVIEIGRNPDDLSHEWPHFLPNGRDFLFYVNSKDESRSGTYVASLDRPERVRVLDGLSVAAVYSEPGYLLFLRGNAIMAQRFDLSRRRVEGVPVVLATTTSAPRSSDGTPLSASADLLAYRSDTATQRLVWIDRNGGEIASPEGPDKIQGPTLSVDGQFLLADSRTLPGVWLFDLQRDTFLRLLAEGETPVPSPDGKRLAFTSNWRTGTTNIFATTLERPERVEPLLRGEQPVFITDWSADGRYLIYNQSSLDKGDDIWLLPMQGDRRPIPHVQTPFNDVQGKVSPDGRWLAYTSDESGANEIYVQSFPEPGTKQRISLHGGSEAQWSHDGTELFYLEADRTLMSVRVTSREPLKLAEPRALFATPLLVEGGRRFRYAVARNDRFVFESYRPEKESERGITVVANWHRRLTQLP